MSGILIKPRLILKKHGVDFADVIPVLKDEAAITIFDEHSTEDRYITIGMATNSRILVVVYTVRENKIRIISARQANKHECKQYFQ